MIVYLSTIIITLFLGYILLQYEYETGKSFRKEYIFIISVVLILESGLRNWAVGADTYAYYLGYEETRLYSWSFIQQITLNYYVQGIGKDPGYVAFVKLSQYILPHYQLFLLGIASIFFLSLGNFIYKNTVRLSDAVYAYVLYSCLFFGFFSLTGHRQTIATAAALYGFELIKKRRIIAFISIIILASTVHKSVLVFMPFYFIATLQRTELFFWSLLLLFPLLMAYRIQIMQILGDVSGYADYGIYEGANTSTFTLMVLLVAVVSLWRMKTILLDNENLRPIYNAFMLAIFFTPLTFVNPSAMRVVLYYSIYMLLLIPLVINSFALESKSTGRAVYFLSLSLLIFLFINANMNSEYKFFWQTMQLGENYHWLNINY